MRPILIAMLVVCMSIAASAAAGLWLGDFKFDDPWKPSSAIADKAPKNGARERISQKENDKSSIARATERTLKLESEEEKSPFDVILVSPDDVSVFAGLSEPNKEIAVLADGVIIGTTKSDGAGNWVLTTEHKLQNLDAKFTVEVVQPRVAALKQAEPNKQEARADDSPKTVAQIRSSMIAKLEGMVEAAGGSKAEPQKALRANSSYVQTAQVTPASQAVPVPIQFVYRQAEFTEEGRDAAALLIKYLKSQNLERVTLSGHADERGSQQLNLELSKARLQTVYRYARANGYSGELVLRPKGESQPYAGVDRAKYPQQQLYQLDRRVELHLQ